MIKTRKDLYQNFSNILSGNFDVDSSRYLKNRNAIKSYIIETHDYELKSRNDRVADFSDRINLLSSDYKVSELEDETILRINDGEFEMFADISDERFMIIHSAEKTTLTDPFINKISNLDNFDNIWIPGILFSEFLHFGDFFGINLKFQNMLNKDIQNFSDSNSDLDLSTKNEVAKEIYKILSKSEVNNMLGITKLSLKTVEDHGETDNDEDRDFIIDDIYYNGKITAKGNQFSYHIDSVINILDLYKSTLENFEEVSISLLDGLLEGSAFKINFSKEVNIKNFINIVFNGGKPFRLFGTNMDVGNSHQRIYAVDMHNGNIGNSITFDVTNEYVLFNLNSESCGNTVLRLLANINHYVDALATLEVGDRIYDKKLFGN